MSHITSSGVATTPTSDDTDAATTAPETLPRATPVSATEDCTVDGTSDMNKRPWYSSSERNAVVGRAKRPMSGYAANVNAKIMPWRRQLVRPFSASCVDRRAP